MKQKMKKVAKVILISVLSLIVVGFIGGSIVIGKMVRDGIYYQNQGNDTRENSLKQLETWGYDTEGFLENYAGIDFTVQAADEEQIPGTYYLCPQPSEQYVIITHGAGGDRMSVLPVAEIFLRNGMNVVTYDQRGCGEHSDNRVAFGIREKQDVQALVDYVKEDLGAKKVVVCGQSMGGMTVALYAATEHASQNVDAVILDSPVPGLELTMTYMFTEDGTDAGMVAYILECGKIYCRIFDHFDFNDGDTIGLMAQNHCKTLVILSEQDEICFPQDVEALYDNIATQDKTLLRVDNGHIEGAVYQTETYEKGIMEFLGE